MPKRTDIFAPTIEKTNQLLLDIEAEFGWKDKKQAYAALKAILHSLRDRLSVNEAVDLGSQLPMLVRGFYYEGWKPAKVPVKMNKSEFFLLVIDKLGQPFGTTVEDLIRRVLKILSRYVAEGEFEDLKSTLPKDMKDLLP